MSRATLMAGPSTAMALAAVIGGSSMFLLGPAVASADACVAGAAGTPSTFGFTGADQCYVVPAGVTAIHVAATGASTPHGLGATVIADIGVVSGQTLYVEVGGAPAPTGIGGGFDGGGSAAPAGTGGGGAGASDVRTCQSTAPGCILTGTGSDPRLVVAGGAGGGDATASGGNAAYNGISGGGGTNSSPSNGGTGGTQSAGGAGGAFGATSGSAGNGGTGGHNVSDGYGGGGGWFGGGGGGGGGLMVGSGGGGGGSSFGPLGSVFATAASGAPAAVTIAPYAPPSSGVQGSSGAQGPAGGQGPVGAPGAKGQDGIVRVVTCNTTTITKVKRVKGKRKRVRIKHKTCTTKIVSGTATFTTASRTR
jgi:hypothetical protein